MNHQVEKKLSMWISIATISLVMGSPLLANAQSTAQAAMDKLQKNVDNTKANLDDYQKNLKIVESNISEITKAKAAVDSQRKEVTTLIGMQKTSVQTLDKQELEIQKLIASEQKSIQEETARVQELEKMIAQLKDNSQKRQQNITNYQTQQQQVAKEKADWKLRSDELVKMLAEVNKRMTAVSTQETEWKNKKRGYEGEISRWQKELVRHEKLLDDAKALADSKDNAKEGSSENRPGN